MLGEGPTLEDGDVRKPGLHMNADEVAPGGALAIPPAAPATSAAPLGPAVICGTVFSCTFGSAAVHPSDVGSTRIHCVVAFFSADGEGVHYHGPRILGAATTASATAARAPGLAGTPRAERRCTLVDPLSRRTQRLWGRRGPGVADARLVRRSGAGRLALLTARGCAGTRWAYLGLRAVIDSRGQT
jgi:hypothetical protein